MDGKTAVVIGASADIAEEQLRVEVDVRRPGMLADDIAELCGEDRVLEVPREAIVLRLAGGEHAHESVSGSQ